MQSHAFGKLPPVSVLTLGGGGLGMLWGKTTFEECVATVHAAIGDGITLLDLAPRYGDGKAEEVVGAAFAGKLPAGVRVTSKCNLGNPPVADIETILRRSIDGSLHRLRAEKLDLFFLHSNVVPDAAFIAGSAAGGSARMTPYAVFVEHVRPLFERFVAEGLIGAWGLTGIGHPDTIIRLLGERPAPAAVQCIANLLDSPGGLKFFDGPAKPRAIIAAARANGVGVMGIRAVQAGALTAAIDRDLPADHPEVRDYARAAGFRHLCAELGANPAVIAHRYALSLDLDTLVLGVKNRQELAECVAAAQSGPLPSDLIARIDATVAEDTPT
ncbi:MAG TPA: aldo/keto reductase [Acetobacteraceae bacterium]|jgi:aryl-alcohol dehydrogenase-like predicted oxidoreductase|nr:aldo/keto reductase [Acetobacteraceae bacterium]